MGSKATFEQQTTTAILRRARHYRGIYRRVATRLKVQPQVVSRVARGKTTSARIAAALLREVRKIEREIAA